MATGKMRTNSNVTPSSWSTISRLRTRGGRGGALLLALLCGCGGVSPTHTSRRSNALVAGQPTTTGDLEAVFAVVVPGESGARRVRCTATLVNPSTLLTAAHCLTGLAEDASLSVVLGANALDPDATALPISPSDQIVHSLWTPPGLVPKDLVQFNDIALLRLGQPLSAVSPISLVDPNGAERIIRPGTPAIVVGMGRTDPQDATTSGLRLQGPAEISQVGRYEFRLQGIDDADRAHKCDGDSGGPTLVDRGPAAKPRWQLIGVGSRAHEACRDGSVDTRVDAYLDWIHQFVDLPCGSGLSAPCPDSEGNDSPGCTIAQRRQQRGPTSSGLLPLVALMLCLIALMRMRAAP